MDIFSFIIIIIIIYNNDFHYSNCATLSSSSNRYHRLIQCDICLLLIKELKNEIFHNQPHPKSDEQEIEAFFQSESRVIDIIEHSIENLKKTISKEKRYTKYNGMIQYAQDLLTEHEEDYWEKILKLKNAETIMENFCTTYINICDENQPLFFS